MVIWPPLLPTLRLTLYNVLHWSWSEEQVSMRVSLDRWHNGMWGHPSYNVCKGHQPNNLHMVLIHVIDWLHNNQPHIWHTVRIDEVTKDDAQGVRQDREGGGSVMSPWEVCNLGNGLEKMDQDKFTDNLKLLPLEQCNKGLINCQVWPW